MKILDQAHDVTVSVSHSPLLFKFFLMMDSLSAKCIP